MNDGLEIVVSQEQGRVPVTVLLIKGQLDSNNYSELQIAANNAIDKGARFMVLDFSETTFLTSAGLRVIHAINNKLESTTNLSPAPKKLSRHLKLNDVSPNIWKIFQATGFDSFLKSYENLQAAIDSF